MHHLLHSMVADTSFKCSYHINIYGTLINLLLEAGNKLLGIDNIRVVSCHVLMLSQEFLFIIYSFTTGFDSANKAFMKAKEGIDLRD